MMMGEPPKSMFCVVWISPWSVELAPLLICEHHLSTPSHHLPIKRDTLRVSGLDFVISSAQSSRRPSVVSMSLGGGVSTVLDDAVASVRPKICYCWSNMLTKSIGHECRNPRHGALTFATLSGFVPSQFTMMLVRLLLEIRTLMLGTHHLLEPRVPTPSVLPQLPMLVLRSPTMALLLIFSLLDNLSSVLGLAAQLFVHAN